MLTDRDESCRGCERGTFNISIGHLTILRQQKLIDSSRIGACFWLPQPAHIEAKETSMLILGWHLWLASKSTIQNGCTCRITHYRPLTLSKQNCLTKNQPDSYRSAAR